MRFDPPSMLLLASSLAVHLSKGNPDWSVNREVAENCGSLAWMDARLPGLTGYWRSAVLSLIRELELGPLKRGLLASVARC
jgi:hypothetical protein